MVDFGLLPPEINSGRMYTGPGSGPMLAAAAAWSGLAADFQAAAEGHRSVITDLTGGPWLGPSSASLVAASTPFIAWLDGSAVEAEQAASHAFTAAAAYEAAFAATIPPPVIAANRALLAALVATNFLGQNTPAIAATEALYMEFWGQDAGAMYAYASNSAEAAQLTGLPQPAEVSDPNAVLDQVIAAFKSQFNSGYGNVMQMASQVDARVSDVLKTLSAPINGSAIDQWIMANTPLDDVVPLYSKYLSPYLNSVAYALQGTLDFGDNAAGFAKLGTLGNTLAADAGQAASAAAKGAGALPKLSGSVSGVAAGLGKSVPLGGLSVPASWTTAVPTTPGVTAVSNVTAIPVAAEGAANSVPMTGPFGQFFNAGNGRKTPAYGHRLTFMTRPPAAG